MTDPTAAALLRAILLHPAEETPRLMYADYLDEHAGDEPCRACAGFATTHGVRKVRDGVYHRTQTVCPTCGGTGRRSDGRRERAEFIRVQIGLTRFGLPPAGGPVVTGDRDADREESSLRRRERALWREWYRQWFGAGVGTDNFGSCLTPNEVDPRVRRGFVAEVRMPLAAFLTAAPGLFAGHPIESVILTDREPEGVEYEPFFRWFMSGEAATPANADPSILPDDIWQLIHPSTLPDDIWQLFRDPPPYATSGIRRGYVRSFDSRDDALAALSAACVAYGRRLAGLPG